MATQFFSAVVTTPGTPQRLTSLTVPALPTLNGGVAGSASLRGSVIVFQADPLNTAAKSIFIGGPSLNVAAKTGYGMALTPGTFGPALELSMGTTALEDFWIDTNSVTASNERVLVTVIG